MIKVINGKKYSYIKALFLNNNRKRQKFNLYRVIFLKNIYINLY